MHPLDGPRFKIIRAKSQIEALRRENARFVKHADYRAIVAELNPNTGRYALRALVNVLPPSGLGVCIGEIAHNLRSALDGLVYQLAVLNQATDKQLSKTQFPIFSVGATKNPRRRCFEKNGLQLIKSLRDEHQQAVELRQPYKRGNGGLSSPLWHLHEINNADKHRLLQVVGGRAAGYTVGGAWGDEPMPDYRISLRVVFEDGAQIGSVAATDVLRRTVLMQQKIPTLIAFWDGCAAVTGRGVAHVLSQIAATVDQIVEGFGPEFDEPPRP